MNDAELKEMFAENRRHSEALLNEVKHHVDLVSEATRSEVKQVAEGVDLLGEQFQQLREKDSGRVWREFDQVKAMMKFSPAELHRQITGLESRVEQLEAAVFGGSR